ncbi:MAG: antibiotic biosynthesis monooxygenase [Acidobacteriota bacterium]|nr:antibiotic biosynthesis monooxygenase [Acidobacteriota bacterium]
MYVVDVIYKIQAGHEAEAEDYLRQLAVATRREPGNLMYLVHRSVDDPGRFLIYEQYRSHADLEFHRTQDYFERYATNGLRSIAESKTIGEFTPLEPEGT